MCTYSYIHFHHTPPCRMPLEHRVHYKYCKEALEPVAVHPGSEPTTNIDHDSCGLSSDTEADDEFVTSYPRVSAVDDFFSDSATAASFVKLTSPRLTPNLNRGVALPSTGFEMWLDPPMTDLSQWSDDGMEQDPTTAITDPARFMPLPVNDLSSNVFINNISHMGHGGQNRPMLEPTRASIATQAMKSSPKQHHHLLQNNKPRACGNASYDGASGAACLPLLGCQQGVCAGPVPMATSAVDDDNGATAECGSGSHYTSGGTAPVMPIPIPGAGVGQGTAGRPTTHGSSPPAPEPITGFDKPWICCECSSGGNYYLWCNAMSKTDPDTKCYHRRCYNCPPEQ